MAILPGNKTCFVWPWLIYVEPDARPLDIAHEVAHALLYRRGFSKSWAKVRMTELQYEAIVWSVCAKFVKDEVWDLDYIKKKLKSKE